MPENQSKTAVGERLKIFRGHLGDTQSEFSSRLEIDQRNLSKIETGGRSLGATLMRKLTNEFPQLNMNWLMTGKGEMLKKGSETNSIVEGLKPLVKVSSEGWLFATAIIEHYIKTISKITGKPEEEIRKELEQILDEKRELLMHKLMAGI